MEAQVIGISALVIALAFYLGVLVGRVLERYNVAWELVKADERYSEIASLIRSKRRINRFI